MTSHAIDHVAIVGGGFSGTLQAINLLRHGGPCATLISGWRESRAGSPVPPSMPTTC